MQKGYLNPTPDQTFELIGEGDYDFVKILDHARWMQAKGDVEGACNARYEAVQRIEELLPEDEEVNFEFSHDNTCAALEIIHASAIDHFLINDFELSTALLEMLLDLDPEDHLEASELLAFDYLAMDEQELFNEVLNDVSDKSASRVVLLLLSVFRQEGALPKEELQRFRTRFAAYYDEFIAIEHPVNEQYVRDISSERPTLEAQARELWLQTENLWGLWPQFIEALRQSSTK